MRYVMLLALAAIGCGGEKTGDGEGPVTGALTSYTKKAKRPEAMIQLNKIGKHAVIEFNVNATFPKAAAPLTPAAECCAQNAGGKRKCAAVAADWDTPAWRALDFAMDVDSYFRYSYEPRPDGTGFVARAIGDLDCDGNLITYELRGAVVNGTPTTELVEPPPNTD